MQENDLPASLTDEWDQRIGAGSAKGLGCRPVGIDVQPHNEAKIQRVSAPWTVREVGGSHPFVDPGFKLLPRLGRGKLVGIGSVGVSHAGSLRDQVPPGRALSTSPKRRSVVGGRTFAERLVEFARFLVQHGVRTRIRTGVSTAR
jgi:hypothetical protein